MAQDIDVALAKAIETTTSELEQARETVRALANELSDVVDIIEPALKEQAARLRQARMSSLDEVRQVATAIREVSDLLLSPKTEQMCARAERFVAVMRDLEEFRLCGALEAFVRVFGLVDHVSTS